MTSEAYSAASELSSRTVFALVSGDGHFRLERGAHGSKRALDVSVEEEDSLALSKRAASCRPEDLSCQERTLFEKLPDGSCALAYEAESRFSSQAAAATVAAACNTDLREMIRLAYIAEHRDPPDPFYMERHSQTVQASQYLEPSMRTVAVSWLVEVACEFQLQQDTLFLAACLLDRFLSRARAVPRNHLQLTSVACMLIAAKHEETERVPSVRDFTNIADHCFQELAMLDYGMLRFWPSQIAAAAIFIAQADKGAPEVAAALQQVAGYYPSQLAACAQQLQALQQAAFDAVDIYNPLMAVKEKYRDVHWHCVSHDIPAEVATVATLASVASRSSNVAS